jgi:uncharacterized protein YqhQ
LSSSPFKSGWRRTASVVQSSLILPLSLTSAEPSKKIGGQAVIEGVMMRGEDSWAVKIRTLDQEIVGRVAPHKSWTKNKPWKYPFARGLVVLFESLILGVKALNYSTEVLAEDLKNVEDLEKRLKSVDKIFQKLEKKAVVRPDRKTAAPAELDKIRRELSTAAEIAKKFSLANKVVPMGDPDSRSAETDESRQSASSSSPLAAPSTPLFAIGALAEEADLLLKAGSPENQNGQKAEAKDGLDEVAATDDASPALADLKLARDKLALAVEKLLLLTRGKLPEPTDHDPNPAVEPGSLTDRLDVPPGDSVLEMAADRVGPKKRSGRIDNAADVDKAGEAVDRSMAAAPSPSLNAATKSLDAKSSAALAPEAKNPDAKDSEAKVFEAKDQKAGTFDAKISEAKDSEAETPDAKALDAAEETKANNAETRQKALHPAYLVMSLVFGVGLSLFLFVFLPHVLSLWLGQFGGFDESGFLFHAVDGVLKFAFFLAYIWGIGLIPEIGRVYAYHGAEHQAIHVYEAGLPLEPDSAETFPTWHPRCGTAFLFLVLAVSILFFAVVFPLAVDLDGLSRTARAFAGAGLKIVLTPLLAAAAYEVSRLAGKPKANPFWTAMVWPGLLLQRLTARRPDKSQLEVAFSSLAAVLPPNESLSEAG